MINTLVYFLNYCTHRHKVHRDLILIEKQITIYNMLILNKLIFFVLLIDLITYI